jgi:hypothetical protein
MMSIEMITRQEVVATERTFPGKLRVCLCERVNPASLNMMTPGIL